ncbi:hypothetical protein BaRGS_00003344 [Batillaria attramentaria]|uniref:Uncharacterized protein n=1 Tax=Batillaria attramentaria TaxID=370345 RepID=A0ABD0M2Q8_9CAEN
MLVCRKLFVSVAEFTDTQSESSRVYKYVRLTRLRGWGPTTCQKPVKSLRVPVSQTMSSVHSLANLLTRKEEKKEDEFASDLRGKII